MYKPLLILVAMVFLSTNAHAERLSAICTMEIEGKGMSVSKKFEIDVNNAKDGNELDNKILKLQLLYKDNELLTVMGKPWYDKTKSRFMTMTMVKPTCVLYPKNIEAIITRGINAKIAEAEAKYQAKPHRRNWPICPGTIKLHSDYNYTSIPVETKCY